MNRQACVPYVDYDTGDVYLVPKSMVETSSQSKKRPLGRLESQHPRYTPRQPVLSCHSLDVDKTGSRTYRSKSTSAIIEEQHQLLHAVYMANSTTSEGKSPRQTKSAQVKKPKPLDQKKRRFLTINGNRPWTSAERPKSGNASDTKKRRPNTTGGTGAGQTKAATDTHFRYVKDPAIEASTQKFQSTNRRLRELWRPENHALDDGVFIRGRSDISSASSSRGQWLNFAGGDHQAAGLVQAFASAMKGQGDYYSIDGTVGTHVARQMRRGDKIRVGINGEVQSTDLKIKKWRKNSKWEEERMGDKENGEDDAPAAMPPLSWNDQVGKPDTKVLEPSIPKQPKARPNNCETHPVVFEKLISDDPAHLARDFRAFRGNTTWSTDGFAVRSRVKPRIGIDGTTTQQITNITIDKRHGSDNEDDEISVEDILEKRLQGSDLVHDRKRQDLGISNLTNLTHHKGDKGRKTSTPPTSARSGKEEILSQPPSRMGLGSGLSFAGGDSRSVRPLTAHSANNIDQNFDSFVVTSSASISAKPASSRSNSRATSGKRPPPAKPSLHKSAAAMGASIGMGSNKGDAEYIKITHSIPAPRRDGTKGDEQLGDEHGLPVPTPVTNDLSTAGDNEYDQELSQDGFSDLDSDLEEAVREAEANNRDLDDFDFDHQMAPALPATEHQPPLGADDIPEEVEDEHQAGDSDRAKEADVHYAFDIPTAEEVEEEDVEEQCTDKPSLHDRLVEQTAELLAGAIIGSDLPDQFNETRPPSKLSRSGSRQSRARSITFEDEEH